MNIHEWIHIEKKFFCLNGLMIRYIEKFCEKITFSNSDIVIIIIHSNSEKYKKIINYSLK